MHDYKNGKKELSLLFTGLDLFVELHFYIFLSKYSNPHLLFYLIFFHNVEAFSKMLIS